METNSKLTLHILVAMGLGLVVGLGLNFVGSNDLIQNWIIDGAFDIGGKIFVSLLQMMVVPLVFVSLVLGAASLEDVRRLGRIGLKTMALYLITTAIAITIAIGLALIIEPGQGFGLQAATQFEVKEAPPISEIFINMVPTNPLKSLAQGEMLQIILFAIFFGFSLALSSNKDNVVLKFFKDAETIVMRMVLMIIKTAPYGVFCLIAKVMATQGLEAIAPLAKYFGLVLMALAIHGLLVLPGLLSLLAGLNPAQFFRRFKGVPLFAFSTSSSNATIPVSLETAIDKLGVSNSVASFSIPLGATINMDGTAIMQGAATVFIAQVYGIEIGLTGYLTVIGMATLASIGTAGVPGVGLITLAMVLKQVGLPAEGIALIIGVDRILDMARTVVNVTGDAVVSLIVAKSEGEFNPRIFNGSEDPILN